MQFKWDFSHVGWWYSPKSHGQSYKNSNTKNEKPSFELLSGCPRDSQNIIIYCYYPWWRHYFLWPQNLELSSGSDLKASSLRNSFHPTRRQRASFQRREAAHSPIQLCLWKHQPARTASLRYYIHTYLDGDQQHFHRTWCQINRRETEVWVIRLSSQNKDLW